MDTTEYFDNYYKTKISYNASEVDSVIGYFLKRGFEQIAAVNTAMIILRQAQEDKLSVHKLLDTLSGIDNVKLNQLITEILNLNRPKTSKLGYRTGNVLRLFDQRNIIV